MGLFIMKICLILNLCLTNPLHASLLVPNDRPIYWDMTGDIKIGLLENLQEKGSRADLCIEQPSLLSVQRTEVFHKTVQEINALDEILPNITLGFVIFDACGGPRGAMARSTYFIENHLPCHVSENVTANYCTTTDNTTSLIEQQPHLDVVGIIGPGYSSEAVPVGSLYNVFEIPQISQSATSDELSDKTRYKYFSRICPPDRFLADAILDMLLHYDWTYIIVLYSEGNYGENLAKQLEKQVKGTGICFAMFYRISSTADQTEFDEITDKMAGEKSRARVIVSFMESSDVKAIMRALRPKVQRNPFIYIAGDWFQSIYESDEADMSLGSMFLNTLPADIPGFEEFFTARRPWDEPKNPWLSMKWEEVFGCNWTAERVSVDSCYRYTDIKEMPTGYVPLNSNRHTSRYADAVRVFSTALHRLFTDHCPHVFTSPAEARDCVSGDRLLHYIRNTSFVGLNGLITFDESGDFRAKFAIQQITRDAETGEFKLVIVGVWDIFAPPGDRLTIYDDVIDFRMGHIGGVENEVTNVVNNSLKSVCSEPCPLRHSRVSDEVPCCWECNRCRDNEILVKNGTACQTCPLNMWPDDVTGTFCNDIHKTYLEWASPITIALIAVASLGFVAAIFVVVVFFLKRSHKLVRATSYELSNFILIGTMLACMDVFLVIVRPTRAICIVRRITFHLAVTLMYAPLLIKTVRIYRVFVNSLKGLQKVKFVSANQQVMFAIVITLIQSLLLALVESYLPSRAEAVMPVITEKYTELVCQQKLVGFLLPLSYNVLIILVCAVLGYLSRKLPQNFNESWYIFIMVATTLFMWVVFLPTYFTSFYAYYQVVFFALCLLLNAIITLGTLFIPRVYAIFYVSVDQMMFSTIMANTSTVSTLEGSSGQEKRSSHH